MDQKKVWLAAFKEVNHRNPTVEEVTHAAKAGFALPHDEGTTPSHVDDTVVEPTIPLVTPATVWREQFKLENGRLPSLDEVRDAKQNGFQSTTPRAQQAPEPVATITKKPMARGKKIALTIGIIVVAIIIGLFIWGNKYYAKSATANRTLAVLKSGSATKYAKDIVWSDTKKDIKANELTPFVDYMNNDGWSKQRQNNVYDQLMSGSSADDYTFTEVGKHFLFFPNYKLTIKPVNFDVATNNKDITLKMNGKKIGISDSDSYSKPLKRQVSGLYKFTATGKINGQDVATSDERAISSNVNVNLAIDMISFDVNSNLSSGDLYIGNTKIDTLKDGLLQVKKMPISKGATAYVEAKFGDQTIRSSKMSLKDLYDGESIDLNAKGLMTESDADNTISSMYNALGSYASNESDSDTLTMFKNGANNKAYQDYKQMIRHNLHDAKRNAQSVSFNTPDVKSVKQTSLTTADAVYQVKTDFYYSSETDKDGDSYGDLTQTYELTAHMVYDKRSDTWQVDTIDSNQKKISEDSTVD